jgi:hypothetical protein
MTADRPDDLSALRAEIDDVERGALRRIEPGPVAVVVAVGVLAMLIGFVLPWVSTVTGWSILLGPVPEGVGISLVVRMFAWSSVAVVVLGSALTLISRRWAIAVASALGGCLTSVLGVLAIWSTQTGPGRDPGIGPGTGLVVALIAALVVAAQWLTVAFSRRL